MMMLTMTSNQLEYIDHQNSSKKKKKPMWQSLKTHVAIFNSPWEAFLKKDYSSSKELTHVDTYLSFFHQFSWHLPSTL